MSPATTIPVNDQPSDVVGNKSGSRLYGTSYAPTGSTSVIDLRFNEELAEGGVGGIRRV